MIETNLLTVAETAKRLRLSKTTLHALRKRDKTFPEPRRIGGKKLFWDADELAAWINAQ